MFVSISKKVLPNLSDLNKLTKTMKVKGCIVAIGIEKAFDLLDHTFLINTLEKFGIGKTFMNWIKIFLNEMESCVINGRITTKYFRLEKLA